MGSRNLSLRQIAEIKKSSPQGALSQLRRSYKAQNNGITRNAIREACKEVASGDRR